MGWDYYNDCPTEEFTEYQLEEHDKQIRADAIDDFLNRMLEEGIIGLVQYAKITEIAEELKAGGNGGTD